MFDVTTMSAVAPLSDILTGIGVVFGAVCIANILVVPALASLDRAAARTLMLWSGLALLGTVAVLAVHPSGFFAAILAYVFVFTVSGGVLGWRGLKSRRVMGRVVGSALLLGVAVSLAAAMVHMPR